MDQRPSKTTIYQNILINIAGNATPMFFAIVCLPYAVDGLGNEKFGILSIAWLFLGYFGILDLGIGRATTKFVIEYESKGDTEQAKCIISVSVLLLILLGVILGAILFLITPLLVERYLNIPEYLHPETSRAILAISLSTPFLLGTSGLRAVLEARQRFRLLNIVKVPANALNYLIPAIATLFTNQVFDIIVLLLATRLSLFLVYGYYCFRPVSTIRYFHKVNATIVKKMIRYGGWLTLSNLIGPVMVYFDRFIIGSILSLTLLTYYSTPYEVITKLLVISGSASVVLFPALTNFAHSGTPEKFLDLYHKSLKGITFLLFPGTLFIGCFAFEILDIWLGKNFAANSSAVLALLAFGVFFTSISSIPFTGLQALNRPDLTAKVHVLEVPIYLACLLFLARELGIAGVALAWAARSLIDGLAFLIIHKMVIKIRSNERQMLSMLFAFCLLCLLGAYTLGIYGNWIHRLTYFTLTTVLFLTVFWRHVLTGSEKKLFSSLLKKAYA